MSSRLIKGSCHCGNIRFDLEWPVSVPIIPVRECGCDYCSKHSGAWTSHPDAQLVVNVENSATVSKYRFATQTADFFVCASCGVVPLVLSEIDRQTYAVVNANSFDDKESLILRRNATDFDGEETSARLQRRKQNWIAHVTVPKQVLSS